MKEHLKAIATGKTQGPGEAGFMCLIRSEASRDTASQQEQPCSNWLRGVGRQISLSFFILFAIASGTCCRCCLLDIDVFPMCDELQQQTETTNCSCTDGVSKGLSKYREACLGSSTLSEKHGIRIPLTIGKLMGGLTRRRMIKFPIPEEKYSL